MNEEIQSQKLSDEEEREKLDEFTDTLWDSAKAIGVSGIQVIVWTQEPIGIGQSIRTRGEVGLDEVAGLYRVLRARLKKQIGDDII